MVARLSYPFEIGNQSIEPGIQGYTGNYVIAPDQLSAGVGVAGDRSYEDKRFALTGVLYPKPFGIQAEYNWGKGPEFNPLTDSIEVKKLKGGYATFNYMIRFKDQLIFPFIRTQYYNGGKKHEKDARSYTVNELEIGVEWQPVKTFELVAMYTISRRRFEDHSKISNEQNGSLLRLQAQINF